MRTNLLMGFVTVDVDNRLVPKHVSKVGRSLGALKKKLLLVKLIIIPKGEEFFPMKP